MSIAIQTLVWQHYPAAGGELLLALKLGDCANDDGRAIFKKVETLAADTRQSIRNVQLQLRRMEETGFLVLVKHASGGRGHAREYSVNPQWLANPRALFDGTLTDPKEAATSEKSTADVGIKKPVKGAICDTIKGADSAPFSAKGCNLEQERVQPAAPFNSLPYIRNPSLPIPLISPTDNCLPAFKRFWDSWPRSEHKKRRQQCEAVWRRAKFEREAEAILRHLSAVIVGSEAALRGGQYLISPLTYLKNAEWREPLPSAFTHGRDDAMCVICGLQSSMKRGGKWLCSQHFREDDE